jgi:hypothetical protein
MDDQPADAFWDPSMHTAMVVGSRLELEPQPESTEHEWCAGTARQHEVAASAKATLATTSTSAKWSASSRAWLGPARAPPPVVVGIRKGPRPAFRWSSLKERGRVKASATSDLGCLRPRRTRRDSRRGQGSGGARPRSGRRALRLAPISTNNVGGGDSSR